ncbi:MAG: hypothetical protein M1813_002035 [Trichoglossum hirsutum]|nr:MAG: hypothetical protein M1813_002035 [Trichoglossum hirsutum]
MPPLIFRLLRRKFDPGIPSDRLSAQWENPSEVFSVLFILGGGVVQRAIAQLAGSSVTPVAFSFGTLSSPGQQLRARSTASQMSFTNRLVFHFLGWVSYAVKAVVSAFGENKLMPFPDYACKVINGRTGYVRDNSSWIISRIVRDFESWMDSGKRDGRIRTHLREMLDQRWEKDKLAAERKEPGSGKDVARPLKAGLCVSIYKAGRARPGYPGYDLVYYIGFVTAVVQLGIAAIPCGILGNWSLFLVTVSGIFLSFATGSISQWSKEKWACRRNSEKTVILTRGNGSQHAIVIKSDGKGFDLEDLAIGLTDVDAATSYRTRIAVILLAAFWILLLVTAASIKQNTWFLLAIGAIGMFQNILVAGWMRSPEAFGVPLIFECVIGELKVMDTLFAVEKDYPRVGRSMLDTFFPGGLRPEEEQKWDGFEESANAPDDSPADAQSNTQTNTAQDNAQSNVQGNT